MKFFFSAWVSLLHCFAPSPPLFFYVIYNAPTPIKQGGDAAKIFIRQGIYLNRLRCLNDMYDSYMYSVIFLTIPSQTNICEDIIFSTDLKTTQAGSKVLSYLVLLLHARKSPSDVLDNFWKVLFENTKIWQ